MKKTSLINDEGFPFYNDSKVSNTNVKASRNSLDEQME